MLVVGQQAQMQGRQAYYEDKLRKDVKSAEEFIAAQSEQMGVTMLSYIYGETRAPEPRRDRRRKWHGWEI
jgi:hypothetical protein